MRILSIASLFCAALVVTSATADANPTLIKKHCSACHNDEDAEGDFALSLLGAHPTDESLEFWLTSLDRVTADEMPPEEESHLSAKERQKIIEFFKARLAKFDARQIEATPTRRLNNREFENSVRDALMIEDVGTHQPTDNLLGDSLHHGFDTHADTLGFSKFHLEQYILAVRKIVDATILSGPQPESKQLVISSQEILSEHTRANTTRPERRGLAKGFDFLDPRQLAYFESFKTVPESGWYRIRIKCTGKDRGRYNWRETGVYDDDPIRMTVKMGNRQRVFELPDEEPETIEVVEWLAAGSRFRLQHPTDGLKMRGNGNFKFQNSITGSYLKEHDPKRYQTVLAKLSKNNSVRKRQPLDWHNWVDHWMGPRPRIYSAEIEGPRYSTWPPKRQVELIGRDPKAANAKAILKPIAERAWRRPVGEGELDPIVTLVQSRAENLGEIEAIKEGIVAVLVSPQFLLLHQEDTTDGQKFASKISYFFASTLPDNSLRKAVNDGELDSFASIQREVHRRLKLPESDAFLKAFPHAWLELNDINFMAPDPDQYRHYHRKDVSEDMVAEVLHFFKHAVENNVPIPELLSADYSFINADLAQVYGLEDVPLDSTFRKYTFTDGRRGGLLGMGAFLTSTADSLSTSPIHRAVYVMENFLGIHPAPPPPDVEITEPDVREAKTIKELLNRHRSDSACAACHQTIDPFGYAFENFDPTGAWRDVYTIENVAEAPSSKSKKKQRAPKMVTIPIDASASFLSGADYQDITGYRRELLSDANRDRFVRCFISKLLTYANGDAPDPSHFAEIDKIVAKSKEHEYRIVDTIAAVVDSPLFRN